MATQPKPRHSPPDREHWPQEAKDEVERLESLNENLTRVVNDQMRVILGYREQLELEGS